MNKIPIGYYSYAFSTISILNIPTADEQRIETSVFSNLYAIIHIEYFALHKEFQHKKLGSWIFPQVIKRLQQLSFTLPIRYITLSALNEKVSWYTDRGFVRMFTEPDVGGNIPMYYDCLPDPNRKILQEYFE